MIPCLLLAASGCGGQARATPLIKTVVKHHQVSTVIATAVPPPVAFTPTRVAPTGTPRATARPKPSATPKPQATVAPARATLIYASLRPDTVQAGSTMSASVQTSGDVKSVAMYLGSGSPTGPPPASYTLSETSPGVWTAFPRAPSTAGQYHFTVALFTPSGRRIIVDNDGWNVRVAGGSGNGPGTAPTVPGDILLAPPFSYGNPVAVTFSAEGKSVSGAEISSNVRPDVGEGVVAQYYEVHLPRAGWRVDQTTLPGGGAAAFSIVATKPGRVCVAQYASGQVHVFYGSLSG